MVCFDAVVKDGKITSYRVNAKISFVLEGALLIDPAMAKGTTKR